ncbi:hypothetical protein CCP2SC5_1260005 [Azospirillaceae bacterium]
MADIKKDDDAVNLVPSHRTNIADDEWQTFSFAGRLTIREIEEQRNALVDLLTHADKIILDMRAIETIDAAGLQLLASLRYSVERQQKRLRFASPPEGAFLEALTAAGFCEIDKSRNQPVFRDSFWLNDKP